MTIHEAVEQQSKLEAEQRSNRLTGGCATQLPPGYYSDACNEKQTISQAPLRERLIGEYQSLKDRLERIEKAFLLLEANPQYEQQQELSNALGRLGMY